MTLPLEEPRFAALPDVFYTRLNPEPLRQPPHWLAVNRPLAAAFGLPDDWTEQPESLLALSGCLNRYPVMPLASVYSGHQFGVWAGQLGDGRALLLGEATLDNGSRCEWQLKGAGRTPYSRFADGRAVLRSSVREYLCSEAMHGLGIPTTRALALVGSADPVYRERTETAAVLTRTAESFIRFGHFQHFRHRGDAANLQRLTDFVIRHYYPDCRDQVQPELALFRHICRRTAELIAAWQSVGFCHGVMNTDNMSVLGLTLDYGPFGFIDGFRRDHICNHSDDMGRYSYENQPAVAQWNLAQLAGCFLTRVHLDDLQAEVNGFAALFQAAYLSNMRTKLGLQHERQDDSGLVADLLELMHTHQTDFTLLFRHLTEASSDSATPEDAAAYPTLATLFGGSLPEDFRNWLIRYRLRLRHEPCSAAERADAMRRVNPLYVLRNHLLQQAIIQAEQGDTTEIERLHRCLQHPFQEQPEYADFARLPPDWATGICVSCSS